MLPGQTMGCAHRIVACVPFMTLEGCSAILGFHDLDVVDGAADAGTDGTSVGADGGDSGMMGMGDATGEAPDGEAPEGGAPDGGTCSAPSCTPGNACHVGQIACDD